MLSPFFARHRLPCALRYRARKALRMETMDFRGWPIRYARMGSGEPVVFLHNGGTSHAIWREIVPKVARGYEVFALDLLGYGASAKPGSGYSLTTYVEMLAHLVDSEIRAPISLVGNCMGSAISLMFAKSRPEDVRALVLVNPLTEATFSAGWLGSLLRFQKRAPSLSAPVFEAAAKLKLPTAIAKQSLQFQLGREGRKKRVHHSGDLCACATSDGQLRSMLAVLADMDAYSVIDAFVAGADFPPISTIWGLDNRVLSPEAGRRLNEKLRPKREAWLEGCGHLPMLERPEEVLTMIEETLRAERAERARGGEVEAL